MSNLTLDEILEFHSDGSITDDELIGILQREERLVEYMTSFRRDAERYRWLRAHAKEIVFPKGPSMHCYSPNYDQEESLDQSIDEALKP